VKGGGRARPPSASSAENTIMTECTQESGHRQSMYALVYGVVPVRQGDLKITRELLCCVLPTAWPE
jgi:hypothetical protein